MKILLTNVYDLFNKGEIARALKLDDVLELKYRAKRGRNTSMFIRTKDKYEIFIPLNRYSNRFFMFFFVPFYCLKCHDATAELADISVGDAWHIKKNRKGLNIAFSYQEIKSGTRL